MLSRQQCSSLHTIAHIDMQVSKIEASCTKILPAKNLTEKDIELRALYALHRAIDGWVDIVGHVDMQAVIVHLSMCEGLND